jgi:F-type H+-transporting ATPase subunit b
MRRGKLLLFALTALLALALSTARPAGAAGAEADHPAAADHGEKAKEKEAEPPIFTPVRIDLGIWTLVVFLVLLAVLTKYAWDPLLKGLQTREETIRAAINEAHTAREEAHRLRDQLQAEVDKAHERVAAILDEARRDAQRLHDDMMGKASVDIQAERDRAHREISLARDKALQDIWSQAAQLATLVSAKTIGRSLNPDDHRGLVDEALAELRNAADRRQHV